MLKFRSLSELQAADKVVLVRLDLNVPMQEGRVTETTRLEKILPTLQELQAQQARVVILSHLGRPKGVDASLSLAPVAKALATLLKTPVEFVATITGASVQKAVAALQPGHVLMVENVRFDPREEAGDPVFAKELASLGDFYVNDAFSASHRAHASIAGIPQYLPSFAGRFLEQELHALEKSFENPKRPMAAILGGAKVSTKLPLIQNLLPKVDVLVLGGGMANTFLYAQGFEVGGSLCEKDLKSTALEMLQMAKETGKTILLPQDVLVTKELSAYPDWRLSSLNDIQKEEKIVDIGPKTVQELRATLTPMKTILWNGALGVFEITPFDQGTRLLGEMLAEQTTSGTFTVAGGGDTIAALKKAGVLEQLSYVSTAGGAFLEWLEGKPLPGIQALMIA